MRTVERNIEGIQDESECENKINMMFTMTELNNVLRRTGKLGYCMIKNKC